MLNKTYYGLLEYDLKSGDSYFTCCKNEIEAVELGISSWDRLTKSEQKARTMEVIKFTNDDVYDDICNGLIDYTADTIDIDSNYICNVQPSNYDTVIDIDDSTSLILDIFNGMLDDITIYPDMLEEMENNEYCQLLENLGQSGMYTDCLWFDVLFSVNDKEHRFNVYVDKEDYYDYFE